MSQEHDEKPPLRKAYELNHRYKIRGHKANVFGTFAEIGAGQEVARVFFQAGHSTSTIAKSMSAYGMMVSDDIYISQKDGEQFKYSFKISYTSRYRLLSMLNHEHNLMVNRFIVKAGLQKGEGRRGLHEERGGDFPCLFSYANTFATGDAPYYGSRPHYSGWMGIRIQSCPGRDFNHEENQIGSYVDLIAHIVLLEQDRKGQYETIGSMGVNLIYAAYMHLTDPSSPINIEEFIHSLFDHISKWKVRLDVLEINPSPSIREHYKDFKPSNLALALHLVQKGLSYDALISKNHSTSNGEVCGNRFISDSSWVRLFKDWHSRKATLADGSFDKWAYPEDEIREASRYFANRQLYLMRAYFYENDRSNSYITVKDEISKWLAENSEGPILPVLILTIDDLPKMTDGSNKIDFESFEHACRQCLQTLYPYAALLITHTTDLAWTVESVRNSLGGESPGHPQPPLSLMLADEDWQDVFCFDFPGTKKEASDKALQARGENRQELTRNWSHLSATHADFLQRIERAGCNIVVRGADTTSSKSEKTPLNIYIKSLIESGKITFTS